MYIIVLSFPLQSVSALASRSCCRGSLTCIPIELGDTSFSGVVAACQCRRPSGQSSCPVQSATMSLTAAATSPSVWAAPTQCVRPAFTNCTARPAPLIRRQSAQILTCCQSTAPCCSWLELRWVRKKEENAYTSDDDTVETANIVLVLCVYISCIYVHCGVCHRSQMRSRWAWAVRQRLSTMRSAGCVWKSWLST